MTDSIWLPIFRYNQNSGEKNFNWAADVPFATVVHTTDT